MPGSLLDRCDDGGPRVGRPCDVQRPADPQDLLESSQASQVWTFLLCHPMQVRVNKGPSRSHLTCVAVLCRVSSADGRTSSGQAIYQPSEPEHRSSQPHSAASGSRAHPHPAGPTAENRQPAASALSVPDAQHQHEAKTVSRSPTRSRTSGVLKQMHLDFGQVRTFSSALC